MKRMPCLFLALLLCVLAACGGQTDSAFTWTREGYYTDDNENYLSVTASEDTEHPGWYVSCILGEQVYGWYLQPGGDTLRGNLNGGEEDAEAFVVTLSEEGEDGLLLTQENGESFHFLPVPVQEAVISVSINTEGMGQIAYARSGESVVFDDQFPLQSAQIGLDGPETYVLSAKPEEGWKFLKWTRDGADFATDAEITVELSEGSAFVAVFGVAGNNEAHVALEHVKTLGEVLGLPDYGRCLTETVCIYAFEQDGIYYRAVASITPEVYADAASLDQNDTEYEHKLNELIAPLPVERIENVSAVFPTQEELDALVGKTGGELLDDGWDSTGWNLDTMEFYFNHGLFSWKVVFAGRVGDNAGFTEEDIRPLSVQSVTCEGLGDVTNPDVVLN